MTLWLQNRKSISLRVSLQLSMFLILFPAIAAFAESEFKYFGDPELDYWHTRREGAAYAEIKPAGPKKVAVGIFQWKKYLDPKNDEFFKEGDYTPPAPFMEIARNPTDENIENWFHYLEMKSNITRTLQTKLTEYAGKHSKVLSEGTGFGGHTDDEATNAAFVQARNRAEKPFSPVDGAKNYRLRMYFDSKCPHCHQMMETLQELSKMGYWIELRQVDQNPQARQSIPFPVTDASKAELKMYQIESVPVVLVGDLRSGTYFKIKGYQTSNQVLSEFAGRNR